jgi:hypothetical protein
MTDMLHDEDDRWIEDEDGEWVAHSAYRVVVQ